MNRLIRYWLGTTNPEALADDDGGRLESARSAVYRDRPSLWMRNMLLSLLIATALLACALVLVPTANTSLALRISLVAVTPALAILVYSYLTARAVRERLDRDALK